VQAVATRALSPPMGLGMRLMKSVLIVCLFLFFFHLQTNSSVEAQSRTDVILCAPGTGTPPGSGTLQTVSFASFSLVAVIITVLFFSY